jgi:hypothetical protein
MDIFVIFLLQYPRVRYRSPDVECGYISVEKGGLKRFKNMEKARAWICDLIKNRNKKKWDKMKKYTEYHPVVIRKIDFFFSSQFHTPFNMIGFQPPDSHQLIITLVDTPCERYSFHFAFDLFIYVPLSGRAWTKRQLVIHLRFFFPLCIVKISSVYPHQRNHVCISLNIYGDRPFCCWYTHDGGPTFSSRSKRYIFLFCQLAWDRQQLMLFSQYYI